LDVEEPQLWHKGGKKKGFAGWDVHISTGGGVGGYIHVPICTYGMLESAYMYSTLCAYYLLLEFKFIDVVIFLICRFSLGDKHFLVWEAIGLEYM
jgi:hypothetical protein